MKRSMKKVTTFALVMAMAFSLGAVNPSEAKTTNKSLGSAVKKIEVLNPEDFKDIQIGQDSVQIKYKVYFKSNSKLSKKEKNKASKVTFKVTGGTIEKNSRPKVEDDGKVSNFSAPGTLTITITSSVNKKINTKLNVEVSSDYDMVYKYSNLYFVVSEATSFPYKILPGTKDELGHEYGIKTTFNGNFPDFIYKSFDVKNDIETSNATVDADNGEISVNELGGFDIECTYKEEEEVGDSFTLYILTPAEFEAMKAAGQIEDEKENTFEDEPEEPDDPNEVEDTDESEDVVEPD